MRVRQFPFYLSFPAGNAKRSSIATPVLKGGVIIVEASIGVGEGVNPPRSAIEIGYIVGTQISESNVATTQARTYQVLTEMMSGGDPASPWPPELNGFPLPAPGVNGVVPWQTGAPIPLLIPVDEEAVSIVVALASMRNIGGAGNVEGIIRLIEDVPKSVLECPHMWALQ
jgi:hypothetical protein